MADNKKSYEIKSDTGTFKIVPVDNKITFHPKQAFDGYEMFVIYPKVWNRAQIFQHCERLMNAFEVTGLF